MYKRQSQGFTEAFSSGLPSLHPLDLLAGIAGAVIVRLAVYVKSKNTKKYRKGIEYGSARWGTAADIAPYVDPVQMCIRDSPSFDVDESVLYTGAAIYAQFAVDYLEANS